MRTFWVLLLPMMIPAVAVAGIPAAESLVVENAHVRELPPASDVTAAYLTLRNESDTAVEVAGASSPDCEKVEFHETVVEGGMVHMRRMDEVVIPAGGELVFSEGGKHIMLVGLKRPLKAGEHVLLSIRLSNGAELAVRAEVRDIRLQHGGGHQHEHNH